MRRRVSSATILLVLSLSSCGLLPFGGRSGVDLGARGLELLDGGREIRFELFARDYLSIESSLVYYTVYYSADEKIDETDYLAYTGFMNLGSSEGQAIDGTFAGEIDVEYTGDIFPTLSAEGILVPDGDYRIGVIVDPNDSIAEVNDENNVLVSGDLVRYTNAEDSYEENDSLVTAADVGAIDADTVWAETNLHSVDEDFYLVDVQQGSMIFNVSLFNEYFGDSEIVVYDSSQSRIGSADANTGGNEFLDLLISSAGTYYVQVHKLDPSAFPYELSLFLTSAPVEDDVAEENDSVADAALLGSLTLDTVAGYTDLVSSDADFYQFSIDASGNDLTIDVLFTHAEGDIDLILIDSEENVIAVSDSATDNESITVSGIESGTYYIWIDGAYNDNLYGMELTYQS